MTRDNFMSIPREPAPGWTFLVMTGPTVTGPLQVGCAIAAFQTARPAQTLRYFTLEGPTDLNYPWMVGEWHPDGSRSNHGSVADISSTSPMESFVAQVLGLNTGSTGTINWREEGARAVRETLRGMRNQQPEPADDPAVVTWESSPSSLAAFAVDHLLRIRSAKGKAMVMSASSTRGLMRETSSYVQFMWKRNGSLIVEIQADYSYWGLSVPASAWPELLKAGMALPNSQSANFHQLLPKNTSPGELSSSLAGVFKAFQSVIKPSGLIETSQF